MDMQIEVKSVFKTYQNSLGKVTREVLKGLNLEVHAGEKIGIMGPSGSGKTTLLNLLGTLDSPNSGSIKIDNTEINRMNHNQILDFRNQKVGFVFQFHHLLPQCTLLENVLLPTLPLKGNGQKYAQKAEDLLKQMNIWEQKQNKPSELSGGECQRAAIARALINDPKILIADEPTGSLDSTNADAIIDLLLTINRQMNITLIIATHSIDIAKRMDKIYRIENGILESVTL
jgi:lipoprotein-releasing system ATP-binding protein